ncbi:MAG: methionyl-tRNA formyltransferase [Candidatus Pacebacteria bacterium]|nr:methionyl-tRNA formyltransferase [Candidatus Paceibacterota bacterium]
MSKIIFFGTPDVAVTTLSALCDAGYVPVVVVTAPDRRQGRGMRLTASPVKEYALEKGIPILQPEKLDDEFILSLKPYALDLAIVIAYGKILSEPLINLPRLGTINIHYSLLPRWRGASPIESAILAGDTETGIAIQQMVYELDAGPILQQSTTEIDRNETAPELRTRLGDMGAELLVEIMPELLAGTKVAVPQSGESTHAKKIQKSHGFLDIKQDDDKIMYNKYRAYAEWPRTFFNQHGKRYIITAAHFEKRKFMIDRVIPEGESERKWINF